ncbi:hypothetical protein P8452_07166 [Trifolium repens]|jgi:hypothetical protein|nr:hypothetical protein QL285_049877 [Trifolium repens]KAK2453965.1 hypothetical protein QL285_001577 [Trifolium repens]WJX10777.1 hypothetical protein P8452_01459 [Trifolium repens]WJX17230.1 hypothetical protein P8452_07166 [Trifolium repens]
MKILNIILVLFLLLTIMHVQPNLGGRILNIEKKELRLESLDKGPVPPSGPSGCTSIPGSGGPNCPMNFAGHAWKKLSKS